MFMRYVAHSEPECAGRPGLREHVPTISDDGAAVSVLLGSAGGDSRLRDVWLMKDVLSAAQRAQ